MNYFYQLLFSSWAHYYFENISVICYYYYLILDCGEPFSGKVVGISKRLTNGMNVLSTAFISHFSSKYHRNNRSSGQKSIRLFTCLRLRCEYLLFSFHALIRCFRSVDWQIWMYLRRNRQMLSELQRIWARSEWLLWKANYIPDDIDPWRLWKVQKEAVICR